MALGLGAGPAASGAPGTASPGGSTSGVGTARPDCASSAATEQDAVALAASCDRAVEVVDARTEYDTLYAQPDGTMRLDVSAGAVRTQVGGSWRDIDTTVVRGAGRIEVTAPATEMSFSDGSPGEPLVRMVRDGHELALDVPFDLPVPTLVGDTVTYAQVLEGVDLIVTVNADGTGFSEVLRVANPEAAASPALAELAMPLEVTDGLDVAETVDDGFAAVDAEGVAVFVGQPALMWDSSAQPALGTTTSSLLTLPRRAAAAALNAHARREAPVVGDEVAEMDLAVTADEVVVTPDDEMLSDPATVWPVYIDPVVGSNTRTEWMAVRDSGGGTAYKFPGDEGVGFCNTAQLTSGYCNPYSFKSRLLWEFSGLALPAALEPSHLVSAEFIATGTNAYSCTASAIQLFRVDDFSSATTFASSGPWTSDRLVQTHVTTHRPGCADVNARGPRSIAFNVLQIANWAVSANSTSMWIGLKADNETSMVGWKRYASDATLSIVYNRPPSTPTNLKITEGGHTWSCPGTANPGAPLSVPGQNLSFTATAADPDGGNLRANINGYSAAGTLIWNPPMTNGLPSGSPHTSVLHLLAEGDDRGTFVEGTTYYWDVDSTDDNAERTLWSPKSQRCYFRPDYTPPAAPVVTPLDGAVPLGQPVQFQVSSPSADGVRFTYSLNSPALNSSVPTTDGVITVTPNRSGPNVLYIAVEDAAYQSSATPPGEAVQVQFEVSPTRSGQWHLDEGTGTAAADTVTAPYAPHNLTLSPGVAWTDGIWGSDGGRPELPGADFALAFDGATEAAASSSAVVDTTKSFTVAAIVRLTAVPTASATAVSQDGAVVSGFSLGYRASSSCPTGNGGCWSFFMQNADVSDTPVQAASAIPVVAGEWVGLVGVYDAAEHSMRLGVCELTKIDENALPANSTNTTPFTSSWNATGALRVGAGKFFGTSARPFPGAVSTVRTYPGALPDGDSELGDFCANGF